MSQKYPCASPKPLPKGVAVAAPATSNTSKNLSHPPHCGSKPWHLSVLSLNVTGNSSPSKWFRKNDLSSYLRIIWEPHQPFSHQPRIAWSKIPTTAARASPAASKREVSRNALASAERCNTNCQLVQIEHLEVFWRELGGFLLFQSGL